MMTTLSCAAIASAIIALGHSLRLKVVAEGVEYQQQLDFLRSRNCDEYQGFLFSKPMTVIGEERRDRRDHTPIPTRE